jgi:uncharacterized protein YceK
MDRNGSAGRYLGMVTASCLIVAAGLFLAGCGTIGSISEDLQYSGYNARPSKIIYSGVRGDIHNCINPGDCPVPGLWRALMIADLPFSTCADTICLPYTIYRRLTESRRFFQVVDVVFETDAVRLIWLEKGDVRDSVASLDAVCARLLHMTGRTQSVRVNISANTEVTVTDYGKLYETIQSNKTLRLAFQYPAIENLSRRYLAQKKTTASQEMADRQSSSVGEGLAAGLTAILYLASVFLVCLDVRRRHAHRMYHGLGLLLGSVGLLVWLIVRPRKLTI